MSLLPLRKGMQGLAEEHAAAELLALNEKIIGDGLELTPDDVKRLLGARSEALRHYGRVELGLGVSKALLENFASSPYIPLAIDDIRVQGVYYVKRYLERLHLENRFCRLFGNDEILSLLRNFGRLQAKLISPLGSVACGVTTDR